MSEYIMQCFVHTFVLLLYFILNVFYLDYNITFCYYILHFVISVGP